MELSRFLVTFLSVALFVSRLAAGRPPLVTGAQVVGIMPGEPVPLRREINEFYESQDEQWDLYVQSMRQMYSMDIEDPLSFYQMAGTHSS
jgi:hypothetical protein